MQPLATSSIYLFSGARYKARVAGQAPDADVWDVGDIRTQEVQMTTVDHYVALEQLEKIAVLKVDAEGAEVEVLAGAQRLLEARRVAVVLVEYSYLSRRALALAVSSQLVATAAPHLQLCWLLNFGSTVSTSSSSCVF